jgi:photosystem II stability/assembly factor-like uncharacterized protein
VTVKDRGSYQRQTRAGVLNPPVDRQRCRERREGQEVLSLAKQRGWRPPRSRFPALSLKFLGLLVLTALLGMRAEAVGFEVTGMGGGGGMFKPGISPDKHADGTHLMLLTSDMTGSYRSLDSGAHWQMLNWLTQINATPTGYPPPTDNGYPCFVPGGTVYWYTGATLKQSTDEGATWTTVATGSGTWGGNAIAKIAAIPGTPNNTIFVGTATGVWRSTTGGSAWSSCGPSGVCNGIVTIPSTTNVFAILNSGSNLYKSTDSGATWSTISVAAANGHVLTSITGGTHGTNTVLFATVDTVGTIKSTDSGATWTVVHGWNSQDFITMAANQANLASGNGHAFSSITKEGQPSHIGNHIYRTTDGGKSWKNCFDASRDPNQHWKDTGNVTRAWTETGLDWGFGSFGLAVCNSDTNLLFYASNGDVYVSKNAGDTWTQAQNVVGPEGAGAWPDTHYSSVGLEVTTCWGHYIAPSWWGTSGPAPYHDCRWIAYTDIGFARSTDAGSSWMYAAMGCPWRNTFYNVLFDPATVGKMYAATSSRHDIPTYLGTTPNTDQSGGVCVSTNSGRDWAVLGTGQPALPCTDVAIDPNTSGSSLTFYATFYGESSGPAGGVYKSTDAGATWQNKSTGLGNPGSMHVIQVTIFPTSRTTSHLFCSISGYHTARSNQFNIPGGIWKSTNGGETWTCITNTIVPNLCWPGHFAVDPTNENVIYLAAATGGGNAAGQAGVYKTTDGGTTWKRLLNDANFSAVGGASYDECQFVRINPTDPKYVYVGTQGHGLWLTMNGAATGTAADWQCFREFPFVNPTNVCFDPDDPGHIYVTTFGSSVWYGPREPGQAPISLAPASFIPAPVVAAYAPNAPVARLRRLVTPLDRAVLNTILR